MYAESNFGRKLPRFAIERSDSTANHTNHAKIETGFLFVEKSIAHTGRSLREAAQSGTGLMGMFTRGSRPDSESGLDPGLLS